MDYSPPGFSVHGFSQARILEWVAISFSRGSSQPQDQTHISCIGRYSLLLSHQGRPNHSIQLWNVKLLKKKKKFISSPPSPIYIKGQFHSYLQLQSATFIRNFQGMSFICITLTKCKMLSIHQKIMGCINPGTDLDVPLNTSLPYTLHKQRANTCGVLLSCLPTWNR